MKKITALSVLLTIIGTASFASYGPLGENSTFRVIPKGNDKYELVYVANGESDVRVSIFDEEGRNIESSTVKDATRFRRTFDFCQLPHGKYSIVVKNNEGTAREEIRYAAEKMKLQTFVTKIPGSNALKLHVGDFNSTKPVIVKFYNSQEQVIYKDAIKHASAFSKVYKLAKINAGIFTVRVENDGDFRYFTCHVND